MAHYTVINVKKHTYDSLILKFVIRIWIRTVFLAQPFSSSKEDFFSMRLFRPS